MRSGEHGHKERGLAIGRQRYDHEHIYAPISKRLYRCTVAGCPHIIAASLLIGRKAKCPLCEQVFAVTQAHLLGKIVDCIECTKPTKPPKAAAEPEKEKELSTFERLLKERGL